MENNFRLVVVNNETTVVVDRDLAESLWKNGSFGSSTRATLFKPSFINNEENSDDQPTESLQLNPMEARYLVEAEGLPQTQSISPAPPNWRLDLNTCCNIYAKFRKANWVPKNGSQFGSDLVLYKESPELCHSKYCVTMTTSKTNTTTLSLLRQLRAAEQTRKQLVLCDESGECIRIRRWVVRQEEPSTRVAKELK